MRAGLLVVMVAIAVSMGPASSAGFFPDLPGARMLEEATAGSDAATTSSPADTPQQQDRVPAPDPRTVTKAAAGTEQIEVVTSLPGGGNLPLFKEIAPTSQERASDAPLAVAALAFVVLFSRFLVRLNDFGRRA